MTTVEVIKAKPVKAYAMIDGTSKISSSVVPDIYKCPCGTSAVKINEQGSYIFCPYCAEKYSDNFIIVDNDYLIFEEK